MYKHLKIQTNSGFVFILLTPFFMSFKKTIIHKWNLHKINVLNNFFQLPRAALEAQFSVRQSVGPSVCDVCETVTFRVTEVTVVKVLTVVTVVTVVIEKKKYNFSQKKIFTLFSPTKISFKNSKNHLVMKLKNSICDETQKLKL